MASETRTPSVERSAAGWAAVVSCWLCGIRLQQYQMVADGGHACGDIRWYCEDTWACTERWTTARRRAQAARAASGSGAVAAPLSSDAADGTAGGPGAHWSRLPRRPKSLSRLRRIESAVAFFAHVGGFVFGLVATRLLTGAGRIAPQEQ